MLQKSYFDGKYTQELAWEGETGDYQLAPRTRNHDAYFLETFGANKHMFGTDWPACLLRTSYQNWANTVRELTETLTESEKESIRSTNAKRCYRILKPPPKPASHTS